MPATNLTAVDATKTHSALTLVMAVTCVNATRDSLEMERTTALALTHAKATMAATRMQLVYTSVRTRSVMVRTLTTRSMAVLRFLSSHTARLLLTTTALCISACAKATTTLATERTVKRFAIFLITI